MMISIMNGFVISVILQSVGLKTNDIQWWVLLFVMLFLIALNRYESKNGK